MPTGPLGCEAAWSGNGKIKLVLPDGVEVRQLYELAESGRYDGGFQKFSQALTTALDMALAVMTDRAR